VRRERGGRPEHLGQVVSGTVGQARRADAEKVNRAERGRFGETRGEPEHPAADMTREHVVEPWLVEPGTTGIKQSNLVFVDVDAEDFVADLGHTGGVGGAEVPAPDHGKPHGRGSFRSLAPCGGARNDACRCYRHFGPYGAGVTKWLLCA
jgi:hypothetical protein